MRFVYLNGNIVPENEAQISVFDRSVTFGDSVYEGFGIIDGDIVDFQGHYDRLLNSLKVIDIKWDAAIDNIYLALKNLIQKNNVDEGFLYLQVTRGVEDREYVPGKSLKPTIIAYTQKISQSRVSELPAARSLQTSPDLRWSRRDVKSTNLLAQVLAKNAAHAQNSEEALLIDEDDFITECGSSSFFAIKDNKLVMRPVSNDILNGITRQTILALAENFDLEIEYRLMKLEEALCADEIFITAASLNVCPIIEIDKQQINNGKVGEFTKALHSAYIKNARANFYRIGDNNV